MFKPILNTFKSSQFWTMVVVALVMINNIEHLAYVHYSIARHVFHNPILDKGHSIIVVVIIELSIIVLVSKGQDVFAFVYTFMLLVLSMLYYPLDQYWFNGEYGKLIAAIVYSFMFTLSIYYFSRMAAERNWENSQIREKNKRLDAAAIELQQLNKRLHQNEAALQQRENDLQQIAATLKQSKTDLLQSAANEKELAAKLLQTEKELQQFKKLQQQIAAACTCEKCGQTFETEASKRSHAGRCKGVKKAA
jgi:hypothetical protein